MTNRRFEEREKMFEDNPYVEPDDGSPRGVNISPSSMVDSVADWSLEQVISYLKKKDLEVKSEDSRPCRMYCRATIKSLMHIIDSLAASHGTSRNCMCKWLSYHGAAIAKEDAIISRMAQAQSTIRDRCLEDDDTDTLDIMCSLTPYSPRVTDDGGVHLYLYDSRVASNLEEYARVCGVFKYRLAQVFMIKSILSSDVPRFSDTIPRLEAEVKRWNSWMSVRCSSLRDMAQQKTGLVDEVLM